MTQYNSWDIIWLFILDTDKQVLLLTMKTAKCCILPGICSVYLDNMILGDRNTSFQKKFDRLPIEIQNGLLLAYCITMYGILHGKEK